MMRNLIYFGLMFLGNYCYGSMNFQSNSPICKFYLPIFNENGFKTCELLGADAVFDANDIVNVNNLTINGFNGSENSILQMTIDSPRAYISTKENTIYSSGVMFMSGNKFTGVCNDWIFFPKTKSIIAKSNVKVMFEQNVVEFLQK